MTYARLTSVLLALAFTTSIAYQAYRAALRQAPEVDDFRPWLLVAYAVVMLLVWAVAADLRAAWWTVVVAVPANLLYGVLVLYPAIHRARPMGRVDWAEGVLYSALLGAVLLLAVARLSGARLVPVAEEG